MGKRPEDLPVDDTPIIPSSNEEPLDSRSTAWAEFVREIADLIDSGDYDWAANTLEGIGATVDRTHRISERQRIAVENIRDSPRKRRGQRWRR